MENEFRSISLEQKKIKQEIYKLLFEMLRLVVSPDKWAMAHLSLANFKLQKLLQFHAKLSTENFIRRYESGEIDMEKLWREELNPRQDE